MRLFIVANTYRDALRLSMMLNLNVGQWTYVQERTQVFMGYMNATLLIAPNAHAHRADLGEIIRTAEYRGFNILFLDEHRIAPAAVKPAHEDFLRPRPYSGG
jgi:hypothetical protein